MTLIQVAIFDPSDTGLDIPAMGKQYWTPTSVRTKDDSIITVRPFSVNVLGLASFPVDPTDVTWVWKVESHFPGFKKIQYLIVPDQESVAFADLVEIDPLTLDPIATPEPAWWEMARSTVLDAEVRDTDLWLIRNDGTEFNAGHVKGLKGDTGASTTLVVGSVTTTDPGSAAEVTITGTAPNQTVNVSLPRGLTGPQGGAGDLVPAIPSSNKSGAVALTLADFPSTPTWVLTGNVTVSLPTPPADRSARCPS